MDKEIYYHGTLRIKNPKTLRRWIRLGWFQKEIDQGWIFAVGCGRFTKEPCTCTKCRKSVNSPLKHILDLCNLPHNQTQ